VPGIAAAPDPEAVFAPLAEFGTVGLAVSGGADSLGLMLLARRYADAHPRTPHFVVYTVDHGLRPEAADEAAFVAAEAEKLGFAARSLRWRGRKPKTGLQQAARRARYGLIGQAMAADGAKVLVTAHHLHDQAETVLMRLAHGSGLEGLRGMDYFATVEGVDVVRPLLGTDPVALRALVDAAGIAPVADPSNADTDFERVRWRALLPELAGLGLTPGRLALLAGRIRDADRALAAWAGELASAPVEGRVTFRRAFLQTLPRAIAVRFVQRALADVGGDAGRPHDLARIEALADRLVREPFTATLHGCVVASDGVVVRVSREPLTGARGRRAKQPAA
jgi:tRNA(Ile)-lysidine synthase